MSERQEKYTFGRLVQNGTDHPHELLLRHVVRISQNEPLRGRRVSRTASTRSARLRGLKRFVLKPIRGSI